jgi:hypothetical protein
MINFFRKTRKELANDNKPMKYMRYAIGEILLVVIGILIALQINNWNEGRKIKNRFDYGLKDFYNMLQVDVLSYSTLEDRLIFQVALMDSIIGGKEFLNPQRLPGIIQLFDDIGLAKNYIDYEWQRSLFEFTSNDQDQNQMAKTARKYLADSDNFQENMTSLGINYIMLEHLRSRNIPVRLRSGGESYTSFILQFSDDLYSKKDIFNVLQLIKEESFLADLKSLREMKRNTLNHIEIITTSGYTTLSSLQKKYPNLDLGIHHMELIGSGTTLKSWAVGLKMKKNSQDDNIWQLKTELLNGKVKFRTDADWTFDWGSSQSKNTELIFKGADIPVKAGHYIVRIDISKNTYEFIKQDD